MTSAYTPPPAAGAAAAPASMSGFPNISGLLVSANWCVRGGGYNRAAGLLQLLPILPGEACTLDRLGVTVGTGVPSSVIRLGVYTTNAAGLATGLPLVDVTVDGTVAGNPLATVSVPLTAGWRYMLAAVAQGGVAANCAGLIGLGGGSGWWRDMGALGNNDGAYIPHAASLAGVTGALPDLTGVPLVRKVTDAFAIGGRLA